MTEERRECGVAKNPILISESVFLWSQKLTGTLPGPSGKPPQFKFVGFLILSPSAVLNPSTSDTNAFEFLLSFICSLYASEHEREGKKYWEINRAGAWLRTSHQDISNSCS